ncbi:Vms1/Ankzf1 family peptidyl-tRNA hydrolase [Alloalcanivorax gelatiniphagus]
MTLRRGEALSTVRPAAELYGDVVTAYVDVSRASETGAQEVEARINNLRRDLAAAGIAEGTIEAVAERLARPTGHGGDATRVVVARGDEIATDLVVGDGVADRHHAGAVAHLLPLGRALSDAVSYVLVRVDHAGADITASDTLGLDVREIVSEGDHDVLHKVPGGGWAHRRLQSRAEDSWDRNADKVAKDLDALVRELDPDLVLLTGDPHGISRMRESVAGHVTERLEVLEHGSRADGASDERLDEEVAAAVQRCRSHRIDEVLDRLGPADAPKAIGVGETLEALRRGQVETLILLEGALDERQAYAGPQPLLLATDPGELRALGVDDPAPDRLDELLFRAALGQDAALLPLHAPVGALPDGVGAVLRFTTRPDTRPDETDQEAV